MPAGVTDDDLEAAWGEVFDALPSGWSAPASRFSRRVFLTDMGRGVLAIAVVGVVGCTPGARPSMRPNALPMRIMGTEATRPPSRPPSAIPRAPAWQRVDLYGGFVSAYVLARAGEAAVVDTGYPFDPTVLRSDEAFDSIFAALEAAGLGWGNVAHVILTHSHPDHAGGDDALAAMGRLLVTSTRHADRAFRIGGDEFAILMPNTDAVAAFAIARRLLAAAVETTDERMIPELSFSGGIAGLAPETGDSGQLFRQADAALYWCKRHGRTDIQIFDPQRHGSAGDARTTPELAAAVAAVADQRLLRPVYQPIFSLTTGAPIGFEGLVRPLPGSGFADANSLFTAAEVIGRTVELDMASIAVVASHANELGPDQYLAANLSPRTMETDQFHAADLVALFRDHGVTPDRVVLELTERETVEDMARLRESIAACRAAGFRLAADDVGAGNAGLRLLSQIRFDIVKIDLSLVQVGVLEESSRAVLRALRDLADRWDAKIVAEGVETPSQLEVVRGLGISAVQGYLVGRPVDRPRAEPVDLDELIGSVRWRNDLLPVLDEEDVEAEVPAAS